MSIKLNKQSTELSSDELQKLKEMRNRCAKNILLSTSLASSGHPGGSLSALDMLLVTYACVNHDPKNPQMEERDRVVLSMGHISPATYSVLAENRYFTEDEFLAGFRRTGSGFPGHVERIVPGVEWDTGNLGQGLSTAVGLAQGFKATNKSNKVICFMGDGEQQKGQIIEAIRYARKYKLDNLIAVVDRNHLQICGDTSDVMEQSVRDLYGTNGWDVKYLEDGHDYNSYFQALTSAYNNPQQKPVVIIAKTIMGKGISFMENLAKYHGSTLGKEQLNEALAELGQDVDISRLEEMRANPVQTHTIQKHQNQYPEISSGEPILYEESTDNRSAYGNALLSLSEANNSEGNIKISGISCDLEGSVKMGGFHKHSPTAYFEAGIQEHHAASMAGGMSSVGMASFFSTFGSFAVSEVYNQNRLNDFNHTNVKVVATHVGLDVGEDGPTHQCIDYLGLMRNYFRFSVFMPADPNQTDRMIRHTAVVPGNVFVGMGRSKTAIITKEDGTPYFDKDYIFQPGKADWLRTGEGVTIITYGAVVPAVMDAWQMLKEEGISVSVLNMGSIAPVDEDAIIKAASGAIMTVEDHHIDTGLGAMVATVIADAGLSVKFRRLGVNQYGGSGKPSDLYENQGLDASSIAKTAKELL